METAYPVEWVEATAEGVLAVLRDWYRQQVRVDPDVEAGLELGRETTVAAWVWACDFLPWKGLAKAMNKGFGVEIPLGAWREVLEPAKQRTVGGVCDLLAAHARLPRVRPAEVLGRTCVEAGVFLTVKSLLAEAGADVSEVAPSTELRLYARAYAGVFLGKVSMLAPGRLPGVVMRYSRKAVWGVLAAMVLVPEVVVGVTSGWDFDPMFVAGAVLLAFAAMCCVAGREGFGPEVGFEGVRTFRDLAVVMAGGEGRGAGED
jgi:hypothetical protein